MATNTRVPQTQLRVHAQVGIISKLIKRLSN